MKLIDGFVVREVAGKTVAISTNPKSKFNGMISLNESARLLFDRLKTDATCEELYALLIEEYGIDRDLAERDANAFVDVLRKNNLLI